MPKKSTFIGLVKELAVDNLMRFRPLVERNGLVIQSDGGPTGQEIIIATTFDPDTKTEDAPFGMPVQFMLGTQSACGKSSKHEAAAILKGVKTLGAGDPFKFRLLSLGRDSGGGTSETTLSAIFEQGANYFDATSNTDASPESCGLHDIQSIVRLPLTTYIGKGGLGKNDAPQYLHTLYSVQKYLRTEGKWTAIAKSVYKEVRASQNLPPADLPKELGKALQQPIVTRWWTVGNAAHTVAKNLDFFILLAKKVAVRFVSGTKIRTAADNLTALSNYWNIADVLLIDNIFSLLINVHMKWYQRSDALLGKKYTPGFLSLHRTTRALLMLIQLKKMKCNWKNLPEFQTFKELIVDKLSPEHQQLMEKKVDMIFDMMIEQTLKHNKRYFKAGPMVRSCFGEKHIGLIFAKFLLGQPFASTGTFKSEVHNMDIDLKEFAEELSQQVPNNPFDTAKIPLCEKYKPLLESLVTGDGKDVWAENIDDCCVAIRRQVLRDFAAMPSTNHNVERGVKLGTIMEQTGKSEMTVNILGNALNWFKREHHREIEEAIDEISRRKQEFVGPTKFFLEDILPALEKLHSDLEKLEGELGSERYNRRRQAIKKELTNKSIREDSVQEFTEGLEKEAPYSSSKVPAQPTILPVLLTYKTYSQVRKTVYVQSVKAELDARAVAYEPTEGIKKLVARLKEHEKIRYAAFLRAELEKYHVDTGTIQDVEVLQDLLKTNVDESHNGEEWTIDVETTFKPETAPENWLVEED